MTEPGGLKNLPPKDDGAKLRASTIDAGRIRLCDDLLVSINRSWQADGPSAKPPVAEFKAMAPVAFWSHGGPEKGDIYLAAVAAHDSWWLGFETKGQPFGITLEINSQNALSGHEDPASAMMNDPQNFLLVPDQPWFDAIRDRDGLYHQLIASFGQPENPDVGATTRLTAFQLAEENLTPHPDQNIDEVQPLYSGNTPEMAATPHRWPGRTLAATAQPPKPCGRITVLMVTPKAFQTLTGTTLEPETFIDKGEAPAPFDPFQ